MASRTTGGRGSAIGPLTARVVAGRYEVGGLRLHEALFDLYDALDRRLNTSIGFRAALGQVIARRPLVDRLQQIFRALRTFNHPNVVEIHDCFQEVSQTYVTQEYVQGPSLADWVDLRGEQRFSPIESLSVAIVLCQALAAGHAAGIVHGGITPDGVRFAEPIRDIDLREPLTLKAGRLFLGGKAITPKFMNYGLGPVEAGISSTRKSYGLHVPKLDEFLPPEQQAGLSPEPRSDFYSLACLIHYCVTGRPPEGASARFGAGGGAATLATLPQPLVPVLMRALQRSPAERYLRAEEMGEVLQSLLDYFIAHPPAETAPAREQPEPSGAAAEGLSNDASPEAHRPGTPSPVASSSPGTPRPDSPAAPKSERPGRGVPTPSSRTPEPPPPSYAEPTPREPSQPDTAPLAPVYGRRTRERVPTPHPRPDPTLEPSSRPTRRRTPVPDPEPVRVFEMPPPEPPPPPAAPDEPAPSPEIAREQESQSSPRAESRAVPSGSVSAPTPPTVEPPPRRPHPEGGILPKVERDPSWRPPLRASSRDSERPITHSDRPITQGGGIERPPPIRPSGPATPAASAPPTKNHPRHLARTVSPLVTLPEMILIPGGTFLMGGDENDDERPLHPCTIDPFYLAIHPVTNEEYRCFVLAEGHHPPRPQTEQYSIWDGTRFSHEQARRPVVHISWDDAVAYCRWLSEMTGERFRIPTEAEWERAARGGLERKKYPWGDEEPTARAAFDLLWTGPTVIPEVCSYAPNGYGLFDMSGLVWEWCLDFYHKRYYELPESTESNPVNEAPSVQRVQRGGAWLTGARSLRCSFRGKHRPDSATVAFGFRIVRVP